MSKEDKICCLTCKKEKSRANFYVTDSVLFSSGVFEVCKVCIKNIIDNKGLDGVKLILRTMNKPFDEKLYFETTKEHFGNYMRQINSLHQYEGATWEDSVFNNFNENNRENNKKEISDENVIKDNVFVFEENKQELIDRWGLGYTPEEYYLFEKKYHDLKKHYSERTSMHTEALLTYIRYRVKEEIATAQGDAKAAKDWGTLARDAADAAKLNPRQLSKADLSDGFDSFSQLVRSVEQAVDVIEILPEFKEKPKDKVDFTIWCYVNYIRDLKGLPPAKYSDIYAFYEERKKEYEEMKEVDVDG